MDSFITCLKKYAVFSGRARRREYWMFILFFFIFVCVTIGLDYLLGLTIPGEEFGPIYLIYFFATILPGLAVQIRRLHDIGKSGWYLLLSLIPLIGGIWILVLFCTEGTPGLNYYGPNPKENTNSMYNNENLYIEKSIYAKTYNKKAPTALIIFGFIFGVMGSLMPTFGLIGLVIGLILLLKNGRDPEGNKSKFYDKASRRHGMIITIISIACSLILSTIFEMMGFYL